MENKPGNGKDSPFGNEQGATSAGASKGSHDFVKDPTSNAGGAHDFVRDPKGTITGPKPADLVKDPGGSSSSAPTQQSGPPPTLAPSSVPAGGRLPFKGDPKPNESGGKPFKIDVGQASLSGSLTIGPVSSGDNVFPSATSTVNLASTPNPKPSTVDTGFHWRSISSPSAYVTLSGIGASDTVTQCDTLYFKCTAPMKLRITYYDPSGDILSVEPVNGTKITEAPSGNYIKLLEVMGSGPIEYLASGQQ